MLDIIIANIDALINYVPLFAVSVYTLNLRLSKKLASFLLLIYCLVVVAASVTLTYLNGSSLLTGNYLLLLSIPLLVFYLIIVEDNVAKSLFVFFSLFTYTMFIDLNTTMLIVALELEGNALLINILVKTVLHTLLFFPVIKYVTIPFNKVLMNVDKRYWYLLSVLPILVCFVTLILSREGFIHVGSNEFIIINSVCIFSFALFFLIYYAFKNTLKIVELKNNMTRAENQLSLQREHYKQLSDSILNLKRLQHDTKYHLSTIRQLAKKENIGGIINYLDQILEKQPDFNLKTVCEHFSADAILRHYLMLASSKGIPIKINAKIPYDINIDGYDMSIILGNCLENAIEACEKIRNKSDRKIEVTASIKKSYFIIKITNSYIEELNYKDGVLATLKTTGGHGFGLRNVRMVAEKYKGNVRIEPAGNQFSVVIALFVGKIEPALNA